MRPGLRIYRRWMIDRRLSTIVWTLGLVAVIVLTAAFYPSLSNSETSALGDSSGAMSSLMGLSAGIDPSSPLGYLWISLYANVLPMTLIALGIALGSAALAGDEETGALEYLLSKPVTRTTVALSRFAAAVTVLAFVSALSALSLIASIPAFGLDDAVSTTAPDGTVVTQPGATAGDIAAGTFAAFAVALGSLGVAYLIGGVTGRKGLATGIAAGIALGGYVLYTLSDSTGSLEALTWVSPWRWYIDDAMLLDGLTASVALPFVLALVGLLVGWWAFVHRDLQNP